MIDFEKGDQVMGEFFADFGKFFGRHKVLFFVAALLSISFSLLITSMGIPFWVIYFTSAVIGLGAGELGQRDDKKNNVGFYAPREF